MKRKTHAGMWLPLFGMWTLAVSPVAAQDQAATEAAAAWAKAAQPGPEHERLDMFVGQWTLAGKHWMAPDADPQAITGEVEAKWVLGNRFVLAEGTLGGGVFRTIELMGYDNISQQYVTMSASTMSTAIYKAVGTYDASGKIFTFTSEYDDPVTGKTRKTRQTMRTINDDEHVTEAYDQGPDGSEYKMLEMTYTRAKQDTVPAAGQDLALVQGKWVNTYNEGGTAIQAVKEIKGNRETLTRYADGKVVSAATVEFGLERRKNVKIFTFFNLEITEGPRKGHRNPTEQSYIYRVDRDTFTEVWGLLEGDAHAPELIIWRRADGPATTPAQDEQRGLLERLLRGIGASRQEQ